MEDPSPGRPTGAYTAPPTPRKTGRFPARAAAGAGLAAAAVGLTWLLAPGFSAPKAPAAAPAVEPAAEPAAEPVLAMPAAPAARATARTAAASSPLRAEEQAPPAASAVAAAGADQPAWVRALVSQTWTWPRRVGIHSDDDTVSRRLVGWFPANAAGRTLQFLMIAGREETRLYEEEIPAYEARREAQARARLAAEEARARQEAMLARTREERERAIRALMQASAAAKGAVSSRLITTDKQTAMEFTYADGRKEVVPYDPLVFDLKGSGIKTTTKKVLFDLYGYGKAEKTQWMNDLDEGSGILVFDATGSGRSGKSGAEVFGDRTDLWGVGRPSGLANGFEALHALVHKAVGEGVLPRSALDAGLLDAGALAALEKAYGLRMKVGGFNREAVSLAEAGVAAIALSREPTQRVDDFDGQSNDLLVQPGAVFLRRDGTTGAYMNVWLKAKLGNLGLKRVDLK